MPVIRTLSSLFTRRSAQAPRSGTLVEGAPPATIELAGRTLDFHVLIHLVDGLPHVDWEQVHDWCDAFADPVHGGEAWLACERAWLLHLRDALGGNYRLVESGVALLLTCQDDRRADLTLAFIARTSQRVQRVLGRIARVPEWGREILMLLEDTDSYYRYVSAFEPPGEDITASSGMFINHGCGHFVAVDRDLGAVEPVIVHEMSHAMVAHLPLPAWVNEGMAVNAEQRLAGGAPDAPEQRELMGRHRAFWCPERIQGFWSGRAYLRPDEGSELSYDLGRILVEAMGSEWPRFEEFVLAARRDDAGAAAARRAFGIDLGTYVASILDADAPEAWAPQPATWEAPPEKGGF